MELTFTLDLENHRGVGSAELRYRDNARRILDFFEEHAIRTTIFIVGELVDSERELIAQASAAGHELALHSFRHTPLIAEDRDRYAERLTAAKKALEDASGRRVTGYRAPVFSLTPATTWVLPLLAEAGIEYSSSVLPARHPLYGYEHAPRRVFRWPQGVLEIPVPLARIAGAEIPFLGGIYLRYLPSSVVRACGGGDGQTLWSYIHPYDVDATESYYRFPGTSLLMSLLLWRNRKGTLTKLDRLAAGAEILAPFADRISAGEFRNAPLYRSEHGFA